MSTEGTRHDRPSSDHFLEDNTFPCNIASSEHAESWENRRVALENNEAQPKIILGKNQGESDAHVSVHTLIWHGDLANQNARSIVAIL